MKRIYRSILSLTLTFLIVFSQTLPVLAELNLNTQSLSSGMSIKPVIQLEQQANNALKPVQIQNVKYTYQKAVKNVDLTKYINDDGLVTAPDGQDVNPGTILVDEDMKTSLYVIGKKSDGTLIVRVPSMNEVFSDFEIPEQIVKYNDANIVDLQPAIRDARLGINKGTGVGQVNIIKGITLKQPSLPQGTSTGKQQVYSLGSENDKQKVLDAISDSMIYEFNKTLLDAYDENGNKMVVKASGKVGFDANLITKYTAFKGYKFGLEGAEYFNLKVKLDVKMNKELYIPITGFDIPFAVGNVRAGLFLVVGVNGDVTLVVSGDEGVRVEAGIGGDTSFCIPTSFGPYESHNVYFAAECDPQGQITANTFLTPSIYLRALDMDVIKSELRIGFKAYANVNADQMKYGVNAVAQFFIKVLGKGKNIFCVDFPLFTRQKVYRGGFTFYGDLCAYRDDMIGSVFKAEEAGKERNPEVDPFSDKEPYSGPIQICFYKNGQTTAPYKTIDDKTDEQGRITHCFTNEGIDVVKGDSIRIVVPNVAYAWSENIYSEIPFKGIKLDNADFYNELARGQVQPANATRDVPGWADTIIKTDKNMQMIYCDNRKVGVRFIDKNGKSQPGTLNAITGSDGSFVAVGANVMPYSKAIPYAEVDGFVIEGQPIDTTCGIYFSMITDDRTDVKGTEVIALNEDGSVKETRELNKENDYLLFGNIGLSNVEWTSGDHFIAVNTNGEKKVEMDLNYSRNVYYIPKAEIKFDLWKALGGDLRNALVTSDEKKLLHSDNKKIAINQENNEELKLYGSSISSPTSTTAHAYSRIALKMNANTQAQNAKMLTYGNLLDAVKNALDIRDGKATTESSAAASQNPNSGKTADITKIDMEITKNLLSASDISDKSQPMGIDAILSFAKPFSVADCQLGIYVDTKGYLDIEGYKVYAEQSRPWVREREHHLTGQTAKDKLKEFIEGGIERIREPVVNPIDFENTRYNTWSPVAGTTKHEIKMDIKNGIMSMDGIKTKMDVKGAVKNGKLLIPASSMVKLMNGSTTWDAKTKRLDISFRNTKVGLNLGSRTAVFKGKKVALGTDAQGTGAQTLISSNFISTAMGLSVKTNSKEQTVTINYSK
ncbi:MAG: copper amine oxidase N-terminal domain-containing protein [Ignavibacteriales bacterium]